jgi:XTP/dITP diphosphohydrolase
MAFSKLLVATRNLGKVAEIHQLLADLKLEILSLDSFPDLEDAIEDGKTFAENALIKARYYHTRTGLLTLSDDSGLEVDALGGQPGIYSARYGGPGANDRYRYEKLLEAIKDLPDQQRTARFVCAIALVARDLEQVFTASAEGRILREPRGENGFGYDPIFEYPLLSKSFAELSSAEKASVSHRGLALAQVREFISRFF